MAFKLNNNPDAGLLTLHFRAATQEETEFLGQAFNILLTDEFADRAENINVAVLGDLEMGKTTLITQILGFNPNKAKNIGRPMFKYYEQFVKEYMAKIGADYRNADLTTGINGLGTTVWMDAGWDIIGEQSKNQITELREHFCGFFPAANKSGIALIEHADKCVWDLDVDYKIELDYPSEVNARGRKIDLTLDSRKISSAPVQKFLSQTAHLRAA